MVAWLPTTRPSSFGYFYSPRLKSRIDAELASGSYDLIFVHCSSVAPYVADARAPVKIIDFGDMDSQKWREYSQHRAFPLSAGYWLEAVKLERTERLLAAKFDLATCTTRAEMESLQGLGASGPTAWFPNGVDADFFQPSEAAYEPDLITFVGRMDYFPNQQAVIAFLCRGLAGNSTTTARHAFRDRRGRSDARDPATGEPARCRRHRLGARRQAVCVARRPDRRAARNCARHAEQDPGIDGDGRAGRLQPAGQRWGRCRSRASICWLTTHLRSSSIRYWNCSRRRRLATAWPVPGGPVS